MSNMIVSRLITPTNTEPLVVDGSRTMQVDTLMDHLGEIKKVTKLAQVHAGPSVDESEINEYEFWIDEASSSIHIKVPGGYLNMYGSVDNSLMNQVTQFTAHNFQVTTAWQDLPFYTNLQTGTYLVQMYVIDHLAKHSVYVGTTSYLSEDDVTVQSDTFDEIPLMRQGGDVETGPLFLRFRRSTTTNPGVALQIQGATTPPSPHVVMTFKFKRLM